MKWTETMEDTLLQLKEQGLTSEGIAKRLGVSVSAVKHKYTRLQQAANQESHHHPQEKTQQALAILTGRSGLRVLETHAGYGNMTKVYQHFADRIVAYETSEEKCDRLKNEVPAAEVVRGDSLHELHGLLYSKEQFDVVDVDPYGFPSRYFPGVLELIDDGILFVTFPKYGCAQINRITQLHVKTFYDFDGGSNAAFLEKCLDMLNKQAMRSYRTVEVLDILDLKKVYRVAVRVCKKNAFTLCGYDHLTKREGRNP